MSTTEEDMQCASNGCQQATQPMAHKQMDFAPPAQAVPFINFSDREGLETYIQLAAPINLRPFAQKIQACQVTRDLGINGDTVIKAGDYLIRVDQGGEAPAWVHWEGERFRETYAPLRRVRDEIQEYVAPSVMQQPEVPSGFKTVVYNPNKHEFHLVPLGSSLNKQLTGLQQENNMLKNKLERLTSGSIATNDQYSQDFIDWAGELMRRSIDLHNSNVNLKEGSF